MQPYMTELLPDLAGRMLELLGENNHMNHHNHHKKHNHSHHTFVIRAYVPLAGRKQTPHPQK